MRWMTARGLTARPLLAMTAVTLPLLLSVGCSNSGESTVSLPGSTSPTTEAVTVPPSCSAQAVRDSVERFVAAMNAGDVAAADAAVAPKSQFGWFSVDPERLNDAAHDRASLREFLAAQVTAGQQVKLISFNFTSFRNEDQTGHFGFRLAQRSGAEPPTEAVGKGAIDCDTGLVMVWSVGPREPSA